MTAIRLLVLLAACGLAACEAPKLMIYGSTTLVEVDEGKDPEPKYLLKRQLAIVIQCTMLATDNSVLMEPAITWHRAGSNASLDSRYSNEGRASEDKRNFTSVLTLRKPLSEDIDNYTCTGTAKGLNASATIAQMQSRPFITFIVPSMPDLNKVRDVALWPGSSVNIHCIIEGNPTGSVEWFKETGSGQISLVNGSVLNLTNLNYETDRGFVSCRSRNMIGENSAKMFLRVKHPQAFLPPLLIIIGELVIVAIVMVAYELYMRKKRSQAESEARAAYKAD